MSSRGLDSITRSAIVRNTAGAALLALAIIGILNVRLLAVRHQLLSRRVHDEATVPSPTALTLLSLGHREWAADMLWSAAMLYFGETISTGREQRFLQRYADTTEQVDPQFRRIYLWAATTSIYNARIIRRESVENSIRHLERGLRVFPDDGEMTYQLGFDYYFELPRFADSAEERSEQRLRGAEYLRRAAAQGYGPPWLALSAAQALQNVGLVQQAVEQLRDTYVRTDDPAVRARIAARIRELSGETADADPSMIAAQQMQQDRLTWFPYMPPLLYLFVGPPVPGVAGGPAHQ